MKLSVRSHAILVLFSYFVVAFLASGFAVADNKFVAVTGDDSNPGTRTSPWRTLRKACVNLNPGDQLLVGPGEYVEFNDDGVEDFQDTIFVRTVGTEEEGYAYKPFLGDPNKTTVIRAWKRHSLPRVIGHFDIRGSYLRITGLEIVGSPERSEKPGIGVYSSHDVACTNNAIHDHGGSGISFNHSDMVSASGNVCYSNATTNPNQSSGISSYQPVRRAPSTLTTGVRIQFNVCFDNRNEVAGKSGITDGNGIVLDDHYYTQRNQVILNAIAGLEDPDGVGFPVIDTAGQLVDAEEDKDPSTEQTPLPYDRKSLVWNNICYGNGGRGIHLFFANKAQVIGNISIGNLQSLELFANLPTDDEGTPYFLNGELSSVDSTNSSFGRNLAVATNPMAVAANEFYFDLEPSWSGGDNWTRNCYFNSCGGDLYSIVGLVESDSMLVRDVNATLFWFW